MLSIKLCSSRLIQQLVKAYRCMFVSVLICLVVGEGLKRSKSWFWNMHTDTNISMYARTPTCWHIQIQGAIATSMLCMHSLCMYICTYVCMLVCTYIFIFIYPCIIYTFACMCSHILHIRKKELGAYRQSGLANTANTRDTRTHQQDTGRHVCGTHALHTRCIP